MVTTNRLNTELAPNGANIVGNFGQLERPVLTLCGHLKIPPYLADRLKSERKQTFIPLKYTAGDILPSSEIWLRPRQSAAAVQFK